MLEEGRGQIVDPKEGKRAILAAVRDADSGGVCSMG